MISPFTGIVERIWLDRVDYRGLKIWQMAKRGNL
jgi:hypothetical protein